MNAIAIRDESLFEMTLKAAVIYDDFDFATRAAALLERVALRVREAVKWDVRPWRLEVLKQAALAEAAETEAANADLILFALSKTRSLPAELMLWLERWASHRQTEDAAVMVLSPDESALVRPFWRALAEFAERYGLAFLSSHNVRENGESMQFVQQLWQRKLPATVALGLPGDVLRPPRHWGINE